MREKLRQLGNAERHCFCGKFERCGYKSFDDTYSIKYSPTLLLTEVTDSEGNLLTDHLWLNLGKGFLSLGQLKKGDKIVFHARVEEYVKGRRYERELDYKLARPTKISLLEPVFRPPMPQQNYAIIGYIMLQNKEFYRAENRTIDPWYIEKYMEWQKLGDRERYVSPVRYQDESGWLYEVRQHKAENSYKAFYTKDPNGTKNWIPFGDLSWCGTAEDAEKNLADYSERKNMRIIKI